ncbi:MAG TPA: gas vesicle protein K [Vulgatibacter sp.]
MRAEAEAREMEKLAEALEPKRTPKLELDEENVQRGLVRLVLAVVELVRQLLERQALRRIDAGTLSDEQIERLGVTFLRLQEQMKSLQEQFELTDEDLNLDLGPLGTTLGDSG